MLEKPGTLNELNQRFWIWLDECYQYKPHSSLNNNISPFTAFNMDKEPLRFIDAEQVAEAFLRIEERKVDKSGCISFNGKKYEIENGLLLIGRKVSVIYERSDAEYLWIEHDNFPRTIAKPLVIGEKAGQRPLLPPMLEKEIATESRLLVAAEKKNESRSKQLKTVISFRGIGGDENV